MNFAHVLRTPDKGIVQLPAANVLTEEGVFFSVTRKTCDEICSIAVTFENSISEEYRLFVNEADCIDDLDDGPNNDTECENENQQQEYLNTDAIYVDKWLRRTRCNWYHVVLSSLLNNWYFINLWSQKRTLSLKPTVRPQLKTRSVLFRV